MFYWKAHQVVDPIPICDAKSTQHPILLTISPFATSEDLWDHCVLVRCSDGQSTSLRLLAVFVRPLLCTVVFFSGRPGCLKKVVTVFRLHSNATGPKSH